MDLLVNDKTTAYGVYTDFIATDENAALIEAVPEAAVEVDVINDTMPLLVDALKIQGKEKHGYKRVYAFTEINSKIKNEF